LIILYNREKKDSEFADNFYIFFNRYLIDNYAISVATQLFIRE